MKVQGASAYGVAAEAPERLRPARSAAPERFESALDFHLREATRPHEIERPDGVRFSRHAQARLQSRGIEPTATEMGQLESALDRLSEHGANTALVLMQDNVYVVGVPSRTIITVMSRSEAADQIFTDIDSTFVAM